MSQRTGWLVAGIILIGSGGLAAFLVSLRPEPERAPPPSRVPFASTSSVEAGEGAIPVFGSGTVQPRAEVDIAAEVGGRVVWVDSSLVSGGRLREGQVLFRIDDADFRSRVAKAQADVALQEVELLKVSEEAGVARAEYEQFRLRAAAGGAERGDANPLALWEPQLEAARAALDRTRTALAEAELQLSRTVVKAPFAGVVRSESVDVGQFVAPGQGVARVYASDAVEVVVSLADGEAALIPDLWALRAGDGNRQVKARVVADYGARRYGWDGYVDRIRGDLDERTRTLDLIVRVPRPLRGGEPEGGTGEDEEDAAGNPPLLVGKFVDVAIEGLVPESYYRLERAALQPGDEVWAVQGGKLTIVPVTVLQRIEGHVNVTGPLSPGQTVVIGGIQVATEGMSVRTENEAGS